MKKVLSLALAALLLFSMTIPAFAAKGKDPVVSPEAEIQIVTLVLITEDGDRIEVPAYEIDGYYILLYSEETADPRLREIYQTLYPNGEEGGIDTDKIPEIFGDEYKDYNVLTVFKVDRVGTPTKHNTVEFSIYVPNATDRNSYKILAEVDGKWKVVEIKKYKNGIFTFEVPYGEAVTNYAILYKRSKTSPTTGMESSYIFLLPVMFFCVVGCAYTGKKFLLD